MFFHQEQKMNSIGIRLHKDVHIDCGKLCGQIQQLIVNNYKGPDEKLLHITIKDIIDLPAPLPKLEDQSNCPS